VNVDEMIFITKEEYNKLKKDLEEARITINRYIPDPRDWEGLHKECADWKSQAEQVEKERDDLKWRFEAASQQLLECVEDIIPKLIKERDELEACIEYGRDAIQAYCDSENEMKNERDRLRTALEELKRMALNSDWGLCSDSRGVAITLIENALDLEKPLQVMRNGKWIEYAELAYEIPLVMTPTKKSVKKILDLINNPRPPNAAMKKLFDGENND
jgi:hypothetical protein